MSMIPQPTTDNESLKNAVIFSAALHVFLLIFLYFGLPALFKPLPVPHPPVPFEIVEVADMTNTKVKDEEPKPPAPTPEPPKPAPTPPPEPAKPAPEPPKPTPPTPPQPKPPLPDVEALKPLPAPPQKPKPPTPKANDQDFDKLLKNLEQKAIAPTPPKTVETKPDTKAVTPQAQSQSPTLATRLSISEEDALRRQVSGCWNPPIGARDVQNLIVEVTINVNPDRTVQSAEVVDKGRMASDSFYRAAAESALRALKDPRCTPLELPPDKYDQWKKIDFTFDPRDLI